MSKNLILLSVIIGGMGLASCNYVNESQAASTTSTTADDKPMRNNLNYSVDAKYEMSTTKEALSQAKTLADIIKHYPGSWITSYDSVQISTTCNDKKKNASSLNEILTDNQKAILIAADRGSYIEVKVDSKTKNTITNALEDQHMAVKVKIVPETEATYPSGNDALISYLKANSFASMTKLVGDKTMKSMIRFVINEQGYPEDIKLEIPSGDSQIDQTLLSLIKEMPKWVPAKDAKGNAIKQDFYFNFGSGKNGC